MYFRRRIVFMIILIVMVVITVGCQKEKVDVNSVDIVAKVGEQVISKDVYDKHLILFKKNYEDMYGDKVWSLDVGGKTFLQAVQENVLEKLINDTAIISYMKNNKIEIETSEIEERYADYMERIKDQTEANEFFAEHGIDEAFIKEQIKTDLYMNKFYENLSKELNLSEEKLKEYYEQNKEEYRNIQVKASHILVDKEEEAKDILNKIQAGQDFSELAKEFSKDPGSAPQGGDLGFFSKDMMVPEFDEAAFNLQPGEISEPIKTTYGYHIIKVFDKIDELSSFEDVKEEIRTLLIDQAILSKSDEIRNSMKIERFPENIK
ncbi:MAG: peptidylprolyl isomerase [Alkaliphilus sp.]|nr:peptidylprolyl isomerase [Alkaliphilus sp.]